MAPHSSLPVSIFVVASLFCCGANALAENLDYFHLVLVWPGSLRYAEKICRPKTDKDPEVDFFVEGLYPKSLSGPVKNCSTMEFHPRLISPILLELYMYWPNVSCSSSSEDAFDYLKRAWNEAGKCSGLSEQPYFKYALNLRSIVNLLPMLRRRGEERGTGPIVPSDVGSYKLIDIETVLRYIHGSVPGIKCYRNDDGITFLLEVHICINATYGNFMRCPASELPGPDCNDNEVYFPTFSLSDLQPAPVTIDPTEKSIDPIKMHVGE